MIGALFFTPVAIVLAIISGGAGHGDYGLARLLFPYSMLLTRLFNNTITPPLIALAWVQYLCYGLALMAASWHSWTAFRMTLAAIAALHALAAIACFSGLLPNFS